MKIFELTLINEKEKYYRYTSIFLFAINFLVILYISYLKGFTKWGPFILSLLAILSALSSFYFKIKNEKITYIAAFILFSFAWYAAGYWPAGILNLLFAFFNMSSTQQLIVKVDEHKINYPSLFHRNIEWNQLNNILIKDNLLTIDFKNNKLIQQMIDEKKSPIEEKEFNEFCRQQLNK